MPILASFVAKSVSDQHRFPYLNLSVIREWQLIKMPTAPLIRSIFFIIDNPDEPFRFESIFNISEDVEEKILMQLANQDRLYFAFYGDELNYRFTQVVPQDRKERQTIDMVVSQAQEYWNALPTEMRDFDKAKAEFILRFE